MTTQHETQKNNYNTVSTDKDLQVLQCFKTCFMSTQHIDITTNFITHKNTTCSTRHN